MWYLVSRYLKLWAWAQLVLLLKQRLQLVHPHGSLLKLYKLAIALKQLATACNSLQQLVTAFEAVDSL